jgi:hypothetical protein
LAFAGKGEFPVFGILGGIVRTSCAQWTKGPARTAHFLTEAGDGKNLNLPKDFAMIKDNSAGTCFVCKHLPAGFWLVHGRFRDRQF